MGVRAIAGVWSLSLARGWKVGAVCRSWGKSVKMDLSSMKQLPTGKVEASSLENDRVVDCNLDAVSNHIYMVPYLPGERCAEVLYRVSGPKHLDSRK
jgi:hypothetical protein